MNKSNFNDAQTSFVLKQAKAGATNEEDCYKTELSSRPCRSLSHASH